MHWLNIYSKLIELKIIASSSNICIASKVIFIHILNITILRFYLHFDK